MALGMPAACEGEPGLKLQEEFGRQVLVGEVQRQGLFEWGGGRWSAGCSNAIVFHRGLPRLGGGARREWLGGGKEPNPGAWGSFPDLLCDFFRVSDSDP